MTGPPEPPDDMPDWLVAEAEGYAEYAPDWLADGGEEGREMAAPVPENAINISSPSEAPSGARVVKGPRGGWYYVPGQGSGAGADWEEYEQGDEKFIDYGDFVRFEKDGQTLTGQVKQINEDLVGVEVDGERQTIEIYDITGYATVGQDDLDAVRSELREYFENKGVGDHSGELSDYTDDSTYGEIQDHLRGAGDVASESPMYDEHPKMETASAILATASEQDAERLKVLQGYAKADLPSPMTVYRGINANEDFLQKAQEALDSGERLSDAGFQSATIDEEVAEGFGNVTLHIETDHGVYMRAASEFAGEDEILLPAGTEYEVTGVDSESGVVSVVAHGGFDFSLDVGFIRDTMNEEDISYGEAVARVI